MFNKYDRCPVCGKKTSSTIKSSTPGIFKFICSECKKPYIIEYQSSEIVIFIALYILIVGLLFAVVSKIFIALLIPAIFIAPYLMRNYCPRRPDIVNPDIMGVSGEAIAENLMYNAIEYKNIDDIEVVKYDILLTAENFDEFDCFQTRAPLIVVKNDKKNKILLCKFLYDHMENEKTNEQGEITIYNGKNKYNLIKQI